MDWYKYCNAAFNPFVGKQLTVTKPSTACSASITRCCDFSTLKFVFIVGNFWKIPQIFSSTSALLLIIFYRLEQNYLWPPGSKRQRWFRQDPSHCASAPLPALHLFLWTRGGVCSSHVVSWFIHTVGQLHVCQEYLSTRFQAVGESTNNVTYVWHLNHWTKASPGNIWDLVSGSLKERNKCKITVWNSTLNIKCWAIVNPNLFLSTRIN